MTSMHPLKIVLLRPADIVPYVATMANITAWLKTVAYAENFHGGGFKVPKFFFALKSKV